MSTTDRSDGAWKSVDGVSIPVPPREHPRLFLRACHLPDLRRRMAHPVLQPAYERLELLAKEHSQYRAEWNALRYLLEEDSAAGRQAVEEIIQTLHRELWPGEEPVSGNMSRPIGRMMLSGAIVYDWCHDLLTAEEEAALRTQIVRHAGLLECGYPPVRQGSVTTHTSEHMLLRDMISAGIALYDAFPEMYDLATSRFFREHLPVRNWFYPGHAYHQGSSYGTYRYGADMYPTWIFDRMGFGNVYNPSQQFVPYQWIYMRRPDGQFLRQGDNYKDRQPKELPWSTGEGGMLASSYYGDGYILEDWLHNPNINPDSYLGVDNTLFELLWREPDLKPRSRTELPLTRYMGFPFGWMVSRTGWDENGVVAEMRVNIYNFINHQHIDAGSFQIYHRGPLAIDSGIYQGTGGGYGCAHDHNYAWRTIAHNTLLIHDPEEVFPEHQLGRQRRPGGPTRNDGGQRFPNNRREARDLEMLLRGGYQTGEVCGQWTGPDPQAPAFSYLKGDITAAYSAKVKRVQRTFVFMNLFDPDVPAALAVFDLVTSARPEFEKTWLLHCMEEPEIDASGFTVTRTAGGEDGKLVNAVLLPQADNSKIEKVGGPGKEFWVSGENYPSGPAEEGRSEETGAWRVEVSPAIPAETDLFLNVMQFTNRQKGRTHPVERVEGEEVVGFRVADRAVVFSQDGEQMDREVSFHIGGEGAIRLLVADLVPGTWQVWRDGEIVAPAVYVTSEGGVLFAEAEAGELCLRR